MERVYFDKQIFSHLFKGDKPLYQKLLDEILSSKEHFLFCYSHAHLLDLNNLTLILEINKGINEFCMLLAPKE